MAKSRAVALILLGATFMSFAGLLIRLIDQADGFQILAYRSISLAAVVALVACLISKKTPARFLADLDNYDVGMGFAFSIAFSCYVFAMLNTSVASVLFILSVAPLFTALIAWGWIGERPTFLSLLSMCVALFGVGVMVQGGIELGRTFGNILAFMSAFTFSVALTLARKSRKTNVLGGTFLGGAFCVVIGVGCALAFGQGLSVSTYDLALSLLMGGFTIGIGIALVTWGTSYVPAAEVSLLVLIESVLGPIWVWLFVNEAMTITEIYGGGIVLTAVGAQAIFGIKSSTTNS